MVGYPKPVPEIPGHIFDDQLYRWWWGFSAYQVQMNLESEPGWEVGKPVIDDTYKDPDFTIVSAQYVGSSPIFLFFSFFKDQLHSRGYEYPENHPNAQEWDRELAKLSYDPLAKKWYDSYLRSEITRQYYRGRVLYVVKMYAGKSADEQKKSPDH
jgi:hypothetical protein